MHFATVTEVDSDYNSHPSAHVAKTDLEPSLYDLGSGLACSRDGINFYLKGVYVKVLRTGFIQFYKIDYEWISALFKTGFIVKEENRGFGIGILTGTNTSSAISNLNLGTFYGAFFKKGNTALVSTFGSCPFPAVRNYVSII